MARIEQLEDRRLLATLTPDAAWADDGYLGRRTNSTFLASTRAGVLAVSVDRLDLGNGVVDAGSGGANDDTLDGGAGNNVLR